MKQKIKRAIWWLLWLIVAVDIVIIVHNVFEHGGL